MDLQRILPPSCGPCQTAFMMSVCVCAQAGPRTLDALLGNALHPLLDKVSHWPGAHHAGYTGASGIFRPPPPQI